MFKVCMSLITLIMCLGTGIRLVYTYFGLVRIGGIQMEFVMSNDCICPTMVPL